MSGPDWWRVGNACFAVLVFLVALLLVVATLGEIVDLACDAGVLDGGC